MYWAPEVPKQKFHELAVWDEVITYVNAFTSFSYSVYMLTTYFLIIEDLWMICWYRYKYVYMICVRTIRASKKMIVDTVLPWNQIVICGRVSLQHIQMTIMSVALLSGIRSCIGCNGLRSKCGCVEFRGGPVACLNESWCTVPVLLVRWHNWTWMCPEKDLWMSANFLWSSATRHYRRRRSFSDMPTFSTPKRAFMLLVSHDLIVTLLWMNPGMSCPLFAT